MDYESAVSITGNLGNTSKMPCHSWSISALNCKRGNKLRKIPGSVCSKCYAYKGRFRFERPQQALNRNQVSMSHPQWIEAMVVVLTHDETSGHFRWFASGDLQSVQDLINICEIARQTPFLKHWLPTHEVGVLGEFKRLGLKYPDNLTVRLSGDMIEQKPAKSLLERLGVLGGAVSKVKWNCKAPDQENVCAQCRACWDKRVKMIVYKYH